MASNSQSNKKDTQESEGNEEKSVGTDNTDTMKTLIQDTKSKSKQNGEQNESEVPPPSDSTAKQRRVSTLEQKDENERPAVPKSAEEPLRRNFQIPRKNKEKKALFQPIPLGSREFEEVITILNTSYLEMSSIGNFSYRKASAVHNELFEKEFIEKRRELKNEGRTEKELAETYAFLLVDRSQVQNICEKGLQAGHSKITILGNPSLGVYLSKHADLLQVNPLDAGVVGDIIIFKILKGRVKSIYDNQTKSMLDPTPKHECHIAKNAVRVNSVLAYRAFELTQYYLYEYSFDEIKRRPTHVCPFAVVSFAYKDKETLQVPKPLPPSRVNNRNIEKSAEAPTFTLWRGQLLNKGKLLCYAFLRSATRPFLPAKLAEKLDIDTAMNIDNLKKRIPASLLCMETFKGAREVLKGGKYCSLYELVEKTRIGSNIEALIQKLEKEKMVLVKRLIDKGFLYLLSPLQMASPYDSQGGRARYLMALFMFHEPRSVVRCAQKNANVAPAQGIVEVMPDLMKFIPALHFGLFQSRKDKSAQLSTVVEKHAGEYLKRRPGTFGKNREYILYPYEGRLDDKKFLYSAPKNRAHIDSAIRGYIFASEAYTVPLGNANKIIEDSKKVEQFSPVSDYENQEQENDSTNAVKTEKDTEAAQVAKLCRNSADYDPDRVKDLINLIQSKKKVAGEPGDNDGDFVSNAGLKRKLESGSEKLSKHMKRSKGAENMEPFEGVPDSSRLVSSFVDGLGAHDTDLREHNFSEPVSEPDHLVKLLLETLATSGGLETLLGHAANLGLTSGADQDLRHNHMYDPGSLRNKEGYGVHVHSQDESIAYKDFDGSMLSATSSSCISCSGDIDLRVVGGNVPGKCSVHSKMEVSRENPEDLGTGNASSPEGYSPCPSTPIEHVYRRENSTSDPTVENQVLWKLIPITGIKSPEEQLLYLPPKDALPYDPRVVRRQRSGDYLSVHSFSELKSTAVDGALHRRLKNWRDVGMFSDFRDKETKSPLNEMIERSVFEEYMVFSKKIQELLKVKDIVYDCEAVKPVIFAPDNISDFSRYLKSPLNYIVIQQYVDQLQEKINHIVSSAGPSASVRYAWLTSPVSDAAADPSRATPRFPGEQGLPVHSNVNISHLAGQFSSTSVSQLPGHFPNTSASQLTGEFLSTSAPQLMGQFSGTSVPHLPGQFSSNSSQLTGQLHGTASSQLAGQFPSTSVPHLTGHFPNASVTQLPGQFPNTAVSQLTGRFPEVSEALLPRHFPEQTVSHLPRQFPETPVLCLPGHFLEAAVSHLPGQFPEVAVPQLTGHFPETSGSHLMGHFPDRTISQLPGHFPDCPVPQLTGQFPDRPGPHLTGHFPGATVSHLPGHYPDVPGPQFMGQFLNTSVPPFPGQFPNASALQSVGNFGNVSVNSDSKDFVSDHTTIETGKKLAEAVNILPKKEETLTSSMTTNITSQEETKTTPESLETLSISATQPSLSNLINQLEPEVFNSLVKIIKDVQKNTVKFYIQVEDKNPVCTEIKEYLTKLGNIECHPQHFLEKRNSVDKLLIIIQNEDIATCIHKIPALVSLKKLSCVNFAGVDSLDDVKNHTYNELFVSGGFVVSDESVLNPESVTVDKLQSFLKFLEELNTHESQWQWKIHCKIQKKLKEQGRMNPTVLNVLTLLNTYQRKHRVEILSYHDCDSQSRSAPELDCLIKLQAQNIHQRHTVFLTERNVETFSNYSANGIVVTSMEHFMHNFSCLIGYHSSTAEEKCSTHLNVQATQDYLDSVENRKFSVLQPQRFTLQQQEDYRTSLASPAPNPRTTKTTRER
ncbi:protein TASOR isoform X2 [Protopterus annectens]|uniref:protein TASOR isoform X2 n=1 Tax=Protopterus annectens TaxID=7888 RepID=UPI001CFB8DA6|nr:protein TASOR isoform X2 [Protopterus annectens]